MTQKNFLKKKFLQGNTIPPYLRLILTHRFVLKQKIYGIASAYLKCFSGKTMSPHVTVVDAIIQGLKFAGVKDKNIKGNKAPTLKQAKREPKYISTAAALGLGVEDLSKIVTVHRRGRRERREIKGKGELLHNFQFILYHNLRALSVLCGGVNCYLKSN